jgi:hypothetical protein
VVHESNADGSRSGDSCIARSAGDDRTLRQRSVRSQGLGSQQGRKLRVSRVLPRPLEPSNNCAENAIRPVALGRKNWIHIGSERAGPRVAAIISIVETCRRLSIPVRNYLGSVLPGLAGFPINRIAELTPTAWAARI